MVKKTKLNYVFHVAFISCSGNGEWIERLTVKQDRDNYKNGPAVIAGNIAAHHLAVTEYGVRVRFVGLQEDQSNGGNIPLDKPRDRIAPVTSIGDLELILLRK